MRVITLASGSKGNSTFIEGGKTRVLVDAGISKTELVHRLDCIGVKPNEIDAILITHEHTDHTKGVLNYAKTFGLKVYVHSSLLDYFKNEIFGLKDNQIVAFDDADFFVGDIMVSPIELSHDAMHTNGFSFLHSGRKVTIMTDLGYVSDECVKKAMYSDLVIIESNHDKNMLINGPYPLTLKRRILSRKGHLSNEDSAMLIAKLASFGTKNFVLAHISEKNNTYELAKLTCFDILNRYDLVDKIKISIAYQDKVGTNYILKTTF